MNFQWRWLGFAMVSCVFGIAGCGGGPEGGEEIPSERQPEAPAMVSALPEGAEAMSLLGEPLFPVPAPEEIHSRRMAQLQQALRDHEADPGDADALIWAGRRYAYLGEYRQAIELFSQGVAGHPNDARFLRHRGHRYISIREFDRAIEDFRRAAQLIEGGEDEVEPDGQPNAQGIPTSSLHFNIWYHFGLAHFLKGDFDEAAEIYRRCMDGSVHPDSKIATAHWWYMALRRGGREAEAEAMVEGLQLDAWEPDVIESGSYLQLLRLYEQAGTPEEATLSDFDAETLEGATLGYGIGNFLLYNGNPDQAREVFEGIIAARGQWASFGYIAAEADLARMGST
ncbi:MAG: tetratricopeptide repeat protein [Gemmatimonadetes bacterium]|nr:tetratricopeptide repeat protein [Gemmatimonadota bacterium]